MIKFAEETGNEADAPETKAEPLGADAGPSGQDSVPQGRLLGPAAVRACSSIVRGGDTVCQL